MMIVLIAFLFWPAFPGTDERCSDPRASCGSLPADLSSRALAQQRFRLELRRAGGPRPEVLEGILLAAREARDPSWASYLLKACQTGLVDCNGFITLAETEKPRDPLAGNGRADLAALQCEALLQRTSVRERRRFYSAVLNGQEVGSEFSQLDQCATTWSEAARRVLAERFYDLIPLVERAKGRAAFRDLWPELEVARASASSDPESALIALTTQSAAHESSLAGKTRVEQSALARTTEAAQGVANLALQELRRRNATGSVPELKKLLTLYEPLRLADAGVIRSPLPGGKPLPRPTGYLMEVGWLLAEAIGDLGDRELERETLAGRTLWDQVNEAELRLMHQGKLKARLMASQ